MKRLILLILLAFSAQSWAIDEARGMASVTYKGKLTPQMMQGAASDAKYNALERYIAQKNPAKLRIFDAKKPEIMARIDDFILSSVVISQNDDKAMKTFSITVRAEINDGRLQNLLNDNTGARGDDRGVISGEPKRMVLVIIPRSQDSRKIYDDRVVKRSDLAVSGSGTTRTGVSVTNSENLRSGRESISDSRNDSSSFNQSVSVKSESGGSREIKADKIQWTILSSNEVYTGMSQKFTAAGIRTVKAESVQGLNLTTIRNEYASGNDISPESYRSIITAARNAGHNYVAIGYMDTSPNGTDPQTGLRSVSVTVNGNVVEVASGDDLGSFTATRKGLGQSDGDAQKVGIKNASDEVAEMIVDQLNIQGF